jgi:mono/diheme cytochrome c family protein
MKKTGRNLRRIIGLLVFIAVILGLAIQLVPYGRDHTNPPVTAEPQWDSPRTRELFMQTCGNCHSNETTWPWYSNVAPASWLLQRDVDKGRAWFNVSEWDPQFNSGGEAAEIYQEGEMPPWFYMPMHPEAKLSAVDRQAFIEGLTATFGGGG